MINLSFHDWLVLEEEFAILQAERYEKITQYVNQKGFASIAELTELLDVSKPTVLRDLLKLEEQQLIIRTYGGAASLHKGTNFEPRHSEKERQAAENKEMIAQLALTFIHPGETILLDSGSTALMLAKQLVKSKNITVITNDIKSAMCLCENEAIDLVVLGGQRRRGVYSLVGPFTEMLLQNLNVDKVFLGADAVDIQKGITNSNIDELNIKKGMIAIAKEVILLADSSKFEQVAFSHIANLDVLDAIITDRHIEQKGVLKVLQEKGIHVHIAGKVQKGGKEELR
ncbi:DeoR/GlpR family DNA-binding transcription regulator [Brevibacillus centrosporus]|uniref:DeoR/GlpR family DNA-binding transcription regulator n=1 Tax=Brevibacillus centrosporus TaxID=54910 RepID=UPI003B0231C3